jgi:hypothetical protein
MCKRHSTHHLHIDQGNNFNMNLFKIAVAIDENIMISCVDATYRK